MASGEPDSTTRHSYTRRVENFADALLNPETAPPEGVGRKGTAAPKRFAIYRNNVVVSLIEAMKQAYPSLAAIMGEDNFSRVARHFISAHPPRSAMMQAYGAEFPEFLESYKPLAKSPFVAGVARAERAWLAAYHAVDWPVLTPQELAAASDPSELALSVHPAACLLYSDFPLFDLFNAREVWPCPGIDLGTAQSVLITRPFLHCMITRLDSTDLAFFGSLFDGATLEAAITAAMEADETFAPAQAINLAISTGAFRSVKAPYRDSPNPNRKPEDDDNEAD